ncbi:MAG: GntR family transcriptional regulator [Gemmobacter sp.]|jgi:DNA-binding GntR family transcriptional regulator|nr:GntR family transcriptional regulator [Gemmobacter sp.]
MQDESTQTSKTGAAYRQLRRDILSARLRPDTPLKLRQLEARYGLGWTPLREALSRLEAERLVVSSNHRGFVVAPVSQAELEDLARARHAVELPLLFEAMEHGGTAWEDAIITAHYRLSRCKTYVEDMSDAAADEWDARHEAFHAALLGGAPSHWLLRLRAILSDQLLRHHRYLGLLRVDESRGMTPEAAARHTALLRAAQALEPHTALMLAVLGRDAARVQVLFGEHVGHTVRVYTEGAAPLTSGCKDR